MPSSVVLIDLFFLFETKVVSVFWFSGNTYYSFKRMLSHTPSVQANSCNCKMKSQLHFLPSSHNIHYIALCRSKNRAARNLCGSHLSFCNQRHMFQRTGIFFWSSDLGDNSHDWKLLMASLNQHCKQIFVVVVTLFLVLESM